MPAPKANPMQRLLDPAVLSSLSNLELVARTVVDGVMVGLHRSPRFGFSQEFAEYKPYTEGDDPRYIDWNVYARSERTYIKRFRGETNSPLMILLDSSASMGYQSEQSTVSKMQYANYLAASLAYMASKQNDAVGLMVFDEQVRDYRPPSSRSGQLQVILHCLDKVVAERGTVFEEPATQIGALGIKKGMVAVISDFYCDYESLLQSVRPLAFQGQDIMMFQIMDPAEIKPEIKQPGPLKDAETGQVVEVSREYMQKQYPIKMQQHIASLENAAAAVRADHVLMQTTEPLNQGLNGYLRFRTRRS
ncbi:MAG: DUF58 domain-containing protein [Arenicellaceae bacterium]|nr:DUF58 domain-containing protein [Arenicellaceae bacterium]